MTSSLTLLAGPDALRIVRERGLRGEDVDVLPGASGGPKWLVLARLDRMIFGELLAGRARPLHLIGSSIGAWRLACLAQTDPVAAIARFEEAYVTQRYPPRPPPALVTRESERILEVLLGPTGADEILANRTMRLHVITVRMRGPAASEHRLLQMIGLGLGALGNLLSRRTLGLHLDRVIFDTTGDTSPFRGLRDIATQHVPLTAENLRPAILASGSIPLVLTGVRIPGAPPGIYRDGGLLDYHLDLRFGPGDGLVLYPHFYPYVVPGWFDKSLRWRRARPTNFRRALIVAPSPEHLARLPRGRIPDRKDFYDLPDEERLRVWRTVVAEGERMADELRELVATGRVADAVHPM